MQINVLIAILTGLFALTTGFFAGYGSRRESVGNIAGQLNQLKNSVNGMEKQMGKNTEAIQELSEESRLHQEKLDGLFNGELKSIHCDLEDLDERVSDLES